MRLVKWLLGTILVLIVAILVGGYVFLKTFDLNKYKPFVEKIAYEQTGRKLSINGEASLGISFIPTLVLKDVVFANPTWASRANMAEVGSLELKVLIKPLLQKQIVIDKVALSDAKIFLETTADGKNNWTFEPVKKQEKEPIKTSSFSGSWLISEANAAEIQPQPAFLNALSDISVNSVSINSASLEYVAPKAEPMMLTVNNLTFSAKSINSPMNVSWDVVFNDMSAKGQATTGSLSGIFAQDTAWPLKTTLEALNVKASIDANLYNITNNISADFKLQAHNPSGNFGAPEADIVTAGKADMKKAELDIKSLNVAGNTIKGQISADISAKVPDIKAKLSSEQIDLQTLMPAPKQSFIPSFIKSASASEYVPNDKIPYDLLKLVNADVDLKIGKLIVNPAVTIDNINLIATLKDGRLQTKPLQVGFGDGTVDVNAILDAAKHSLDLKISSQNIALQNLHKEFAVMDAKDFGIVSGGKSEIYADLKGKGDTYRSLTDSLSGQLIVIVGQSKLQTGQLSFLTGDFISQLLTVLKIDTKKVESVDMKCAVVRADFNKGKITFPKGIAVDTDKMTVISNGTLNLPDDKLALQLNAYRNGLADVGVVQALTNLIEVKGTLQKPKIGIDTNGAVRTIAGIMAGPAYAGAQMFLDRDPAPCYTALKGSKFETYFPKPTGVGNAAHQVYKGAGELVGDGVNMAKDAAKSGYNYGKDVAKGGYNLGKDVAKGGYNLGKDAAQNGYNLGKDTAKDTAKMLENSAKKLINNFLK